MTTLRRNGDELRLKLGGLDNEEFKEALAMSKSVPGRVWDPDAKESVYPFTAENAMRLAATIRVDPDKETQELITHRAEEIAQEIAGRAPKDADLHVPYADQLFPYQRGGIEFMVTNKRTLNADELGLGKTVQGLGAIHEWTHRDGPAEPKALIIANKTVRTHWARTVEVGPRDRFGKPIFTNWPAGGATVLDGSTAKAQAKQLEDSEPFVVVNWEQTRAPSGIAPLIRKVKWDAVIADAVSRARNHKAKQTKALHKLTAPLQIGIDGAPIWNDPSDLWGPLHWADSDSFGGYWAFFHTYVMYYEGYHQKVVTGVRNPDALRFAIRNIFIRRTMSQVFPNGPKHLPPKVIEVDLYPEQQALYDQAEEELWLTVEQAVEADPDIDRDRLGQIIETGDLRQLAILIPHGGAKVVRLRQIVSTPALLGAEDKSVKLDTAEEIILRHSDKQFVVFTHFRDTARIMAERLNERSGNPDEAVWMHGKTPEEEREASRDRFQSGDVRVFCATIRAGGEGIDLYAAQTVIFVDQDWGPVANHQAKGRLLRIGQTGDVTTIIIDAADTVDTKRVRPTNRLKAMLSAAVVGT